MKASGGERGGGRLPSDLVEPDAKRNHEGNVEKQHRLARGSSIRRGEAKRSEARRGEARRGETRRSETRRDEVR